MQAFGERKYPPHTVDEEFPMAFHEADLLARFVDERIVERYICAETLASLYTAYGDDCADHGAVKMTKHRFREGFKIVLMTKGIHVDDVSRKSGVLFRGIGLR